MFNVPSLNAVCSAVNAMHLIHRMQVTVLDVSNTNASPTELYSWVHFINTLTAAIL